MSYDIQFSDTIDWKRLSKLPKNEVQKIMAMIEGKLGSHPEVFGKPLRHSLRGHRRLRIGDYRVIFRIDGNIVRIITIANRSYVYERK